ncbi:MAG: hypothetical protein AAGH60_12875 [Pseudomonadota bacterium]
MQFPPLQFPPLQAFLAPSQPARFRAMFTALLGGIALASPFALSPANALSDLTCGPEYSTVAEVRDVIPNSGPSMIDLTAAETDRYLTRLGQGRPANSHGKGSVLLIVPNKGVLLGMTDGPNMCSPYLRVSQRDHRNAMDAVTGTAI